LKIENFQAHQNTPSPRSLWWLTALYRQPFSAKVTDGMSEGTPTVLHLQADSTELVQTKP
jgi:hypothetical protein